MKETSPFCYNLCLRRWNSDCSEHFRLYKIRDWNTTFGLQQLFNSKQADGFGCNMSSCLRHHMQGTEGKYSVLKSQKGMRCYNYCFNYFFFIVHHWYCELKLFKKFDLDDTQVCLIIRSRSTLSSTSMGILAIGWLIFSYGKH